MTIDVKERITDDLQKAKQEGGLVADRIREIVKTAIAESAGELKQGSGELRTIASDAIAAVVEFVQGKRQSAKADLIASIEGVIDGIRASRQPDIDQTQTQIAELENTLDVQAQELEAEVESALVAIESTVEPESADFKTLLHKVVATVRESKQFAIAQEQYTTLKTRIAQWDDQLAQRYGDRYAQVKQRLESSWDQAKQWYEQQRASVAAGQPTPVETWQTDLEAKAAAAGANAAQTEAEVKEQVQTVINSQT